MPSNYPIDNTLKTSIKTLVNDWKSLNDAYEDFTRKKLLFAQRIKQIWDMAKELDRKQKGISNQNHFRKQLAEIIESDNQSILSRWVQIGDNAKALLPYATSLPSQRDAIYQLSLALKKKKPIQQWIDSGKLSTESTVREVIALTQGRRRTSRSVRQERNTLVTLEVSGSSEDAARLLSHIVFEKNVVSIKSNQAFNSALKELLGKGQISRVEAKLQ
jgi:hypothetical protein